LKGSMGARFHDTAYSSGFMIPNPLVMLSGVRGFEEQTISRSRSIPTCPAAAGEGSGS
jgi:hypothetical protein